MMRGVLGAVAALAFIASCTGPVDEVSEGSAAARTPPSENIAYAYTALPTHPPDGLTATNVKDAIDESAAVGYAALAAADGALAQLVACPSTCQGSAATVQRREADGTCVVNFRYPCSPYRCDEEGVTCRGSCISNADCAQGAECNTVTGECADFGTTCVDDFTVEDANGQVESCIPYECKAGACQQQCQTSNDCYDGYSCIDHHCVAN